MSTETLSLEVAEFRDPAHWRWVLKDADGAFLGDHAVALDPSEREHRALIDLPGYLHHYSDPDPSRRADDERRLVHEVGAWIGTRLFGGLAGKILDHTPAVIRVSIPPEAGILLTYPLELAHAGGRPLALQDASLVYAIAGEGPAKSAAPVGDRLRMLALFSLPPATGALNLRRERQMLKRLVRELSGASGLAVELKALQYGVTRDGLREVLEDGEGWDVVHFSGHGATGSLVLEMPDGTYDLVPADDLAKLLRTARARLKLMTLSACHSAAATIEQTLAWLNIDAKPRRDAEAGSPARDAPAPAKDEAPTVARALVRSLDCGVLAMRYAVEDEFAVDLANSLYLHLFGKRHDLARASQLALTRSLGRDGPGAAGALSVATPALFGPRAADLKLTPPLLADTTFTPPETGLFAFRDEPERFVGRVAAMTRASAALAPESGRAGVLFHGMAGAGKTACALELAYHHAETGRFRAFVWWEGPEEGRDIDLARGHFAIAVERQLPNVAMVHLVDRPKELNAWLPRFRQVLRDQAVLFVLDNLESLLTPAGDWRDRFWAKLMGALLGHGGLSRTVLTSRVRPADLPAAMLVEPVHALALDEALLLARDLPGLGGLIGGTADGIGVAEGRALARRVLRIVQGHPKLIELADALAGDPAALARQVEQAEGAWQGGALDAFFTDGESTGEAADFVGQLKGWTEGSAANMTDAARTLFHVLCCLDDGDREGWIIGMVWPELWRRLALAEPAPEPGDGIAALAGAGLVELERLKTEDGEEDFRHYRVRLHPGVAEAGREAAGETVRKAVDAELGAFWVVIYQKAAEAEAEGQPVGRLIVRAGLAGAPYLMRRQDWGAATMLLERAFYRDQSPATLAALLPLMTRIAAATKGSDREFLDQLVLAGMLATAGRRGEAEATMRDILERAEAARQFRTASAAAGELINLLRQTGRAEAALEIAERMPELSRRAGLGPWTQIGEEGQRLQLLAVIGRSQEALDGVEALRREMEKLPEESDAEEAVDPWNVREAVLDVGHQAALNLEKWEDALALTAERLKSKSARGASALEIAGTRFNDYGPLLRLQRYPEARALLQKCRAVFEAENDVDMLGNVLSAIADLEDETTGPAAASGFQETALRYTYRAGDPAGIAISHNNLANYVRRSDGSPKQVLAHRLATIVIGFLTSSAYLTDWASNLIVNLKYFGDRATDNLPASFADLCATVEEVEGVRFAELFRRLAGPDADGDALLQQITAAAFEELQQIDGGAGEGA